MPPSRRACLASSPLKRSSEFASNARNAAEIPEKASFFEEARVGRACRGHCTSNKRNPSDTAAVVAAHSESSQLAPVRPDAHSQSDTLVRPLWFGSQWLGSQSVSPHVLHSLAWPPVEYLPAGHAVQEPAPAAEYVPAGQAGHEE